MVLTMDLEVLVERHFTSFVIVGWMIKRLWWNGTDSVSLSNGRKIFFQRGLKMDG